MKIKRVAAVSLGKILGLLYAIFGFIAGLILLLISLVAPSAESPVRFGIAAPIILPILYGLMGLIGGLLSAAIYNFVAKRVGGLEIETE